MTALPVYIGIDVACGRDKPLPLCVASVGSRLAPQRIPDDLARLLPRGPGNQAVADAKPFEPTACALVVALKEITANLNWRIDRIAIDAPATPPVTSPRACEDDMGRARLSSFRTPAMERWPAIITRCRGHLVEGGSPARLPFANMIWMLYGFELYKHLREELGIEVIETYPAGIIHEIACGSEHKSTPEGYRKQLLAVAARTGWDDPDALEARLKETVALTRHDRLDAFMAAWVASLPIEKRRAYGDAANSNDSIWVPRA